VLLPRFATWYSPSWAIRLRRLTLVISAVAQRTAPVVSVVGRVWARRRTVAFALAGVLVIAWSTGFFLFVRRQAVAVVAFPTLEAHPAGEHNLVAYRLGTTVRVSSFFRDPFSQHNPGYLVDGRTNPTLVEKWASDPGDRHPWVELLWSGKRQVRSVVIRHAGTVESADFTSQEYSLWCLQARPVPPPVVVTDNHAPVAVHALACSGARGVRVRFVPNRPGQIVRIFEIEVWGR